MKRAGKVIFNSRRAGKDRYQVNQEAFFGQATTLLLSITHILEPPG